MNKLPVEEPKIPPPVVLVWGVPNILPDGCAADAPKENPVLTGFCCPNDVLGFDEPNNPPPVFPTIEAFCWPNNPPLDPGVAVGVPKRELPPALKPNIILILKFSTIYVSFNKLPPNVGWAVGVCPKAGAAAVDPNNPVFGWVVWLNNDVFACPKTEGVVGLPNADCPKPEGLLAPPENAPDPAPTRTIFV